MTDSPFYFNWKKIKCGQLWFARKKKVRLNITVFTFVIEKRQIEVKHPEVVTSVEEIMCRNDCVAHTKSRQHHQISVIESYARNRCEHSECHQRVYENLFDKNKIKHISS